MKTSGLRVFLLSLFITGLTGSMLWGYAAESSLLDEQDKAKPLNKLPSKNNDLFENDSLDHVNAGVFDMVLSPNYQDVPSFIGNTQLIPMTPPVTEINYGR